MKKILQTTLLLLMLSVATSCQLKVTQLSAQKWHGGIPTAGYGWYYVVELKSPADAANITFEQLWTADNYAEKPTVLDSNNKKISTFSKGQTIIVQFRQHTKTNQRGEPLEQPPHPTPPQTLKAKALLAYTINGKKQYAHIKEMVVLEPQNRP